MEFNFIKNGALTARINGLIKTAEARREYFWNVLYNCVLRSYEHNDVSYVNKGLAMAKAVGRYKATLAILKQVVPYTFKEGAFGGKRKVGMYDKLHLTFGDVIKALVAQQIDDDTKPKVPKAYDFYASLENFLKKAEVNDVTHADVIEAIRDADKKAA